MKKLFTLFIILILLPVTALAAGEDAPGTLYVGGTKISSGYWTSSDGGTTWTSQNDEPSEGGYIYYDSNSNTLTLKDAKIVNNNDALSIPYGAGIYALCSNGQSVSLTIVLIGENTIEGNYGILVEAQQGETKGIDASLIIKSDSGSGSSSLNVTGSSNYGISVRSGTGDASLTIENTTVNASTSGGYVAGVYVNSGSQASDPPQLSLTVNGGSLTASGGSGNSKGIWFYVGDFNATGATTSLTVSGNAIVDAKTGDISDQIKVSSGDGNNGGIVFDGTEGTVYGKVELQDELTINQGETLTIPAGSSLNCNNNLTNNGTILVESGGSLEGTVTPPTISKHPESTSAVSDQEATFSVEATASEGELTYQWQQSTDNGSTWNNINNATSKTYTTAATTTGMSGYQYRCVVTAGGVGAISNAATLTVEGPFAGGTGTENDPYQIATAEQLEYLAVMANSGTLHTLGDYYILTDNIDLSDHQWVPIGRGTSTDSKYFDGYFNGNGKTITGLYVDESTDGYLAGLFGLLTGQVWDLTIEDAYVKTAGSDSSAGILAGKISNSGTKVTNCHVSGTVESVVLAGGLAGYASYTEFESCSAKAKVSATGNNIGGFIGEGFAASFTDCAAEGSVTGSWSCGGFAGILWSNAKAEHCIADVDVTATDWNTGGFGGYIEDNTSISNCVALGDVSNPITGTITKLGGFVGSMDISYGSNSIENCHAAGTITGGTSDHPAGGFIGYTTGGTITGCSFDKEKNPALNAAGEGTIASGVTGEETAVVLANICEDYYGGHQYSSEWTIDTEPTCTTSGSKYHACERCGAKGNITEIPATGHDLTKTEAKEATCTEDGNIEYWYCKNCGKYFSDENATEELSDVVIPATGHHYVNGYCTECGQRDPDYRPDPISYYNIYVEDVCDGVEISTSKQVVREGGSITVYVEKDTANYTFDNFKVYYKCSYYGTWEELPEGTQPGEYPIKNIWTHIYVKAEGAEEKEDPTGIESIEGVKVYTKDGSLYVQTPQREQVIIVSMSGAVVKNEEQVGLKQYQGLQPGIYIVRVGETTYKIRL